MSRQEPDDETRRVKVLLIDDAEEIRLLVRLALVRRGGMTLVEAATGAEGVARASSERPDAILLDVHLPDMELEAVVAALRSAPETQRAPILAFTATMPPLGRLAALGIHEAIGKPFELNALAADVRDKLAGPALSASTCGRSAP